MRNSCFPLLGCFSWFQWGSAADEEQHTRPFFNFLNSGMNMYTSIGSIAQACTTARERAKHPPDCAANSKMFNHSFFFIFSAFLLLKFHEKHWKSRYEWIFLFSAFQARAHCLTTSSFCSPAHTRKAPERAESLPHATSSCNQ